MKDVVERPSEFGGGRSLYQTYEAVYYDQDRARVGLRNDTWIRTERAATRERRKYGGRALAAWKPEDVERFQREYRAQRRTARRTWDEVQVGDALGPLLKGPLTPTAEIAFESFFGIYLVGNSVAASLYDKHPALMIPNEQGVPEPPQRVHWDTPFTQRLLGLPGAYDLGLERCAWLCHLVTDWIGDDGLLTVMDVRYRRFNFMGDVTRCRGRVTEKFERAGRACVRRAVECRNQLDEVTAMGEAEAELLRV